MKCPMVIKEALSSRLLFRAGKKSLGKMKILGNKIQAFGGYKDKSLIKQFKKTRDRANLFARASLKKDKARLTLLNRQLREL